MTIAPGIFSTPMLAGPAAGGAGFARRRGALPVPARRALGICRPCAAHRRQPDAERRDHPPRRRPAHGAEVAAAHATHALPSAPRAAEMIRPQMLGVPVSDTRPEVLRETDAGAIRLARTLVRTARSASLAVLEADTGHPLASRVGVATDADGAPLILVSQLSAHTPAMLADPRCSLLVGQPGKGDPLAHPRVTLVCRAERLEPGTPADARARAPLSEPQPQGQPLYRARRLCHLSPRARARQPEWRLRQGLFAGPQRSASLRPGSRRNWPRPNRARSIT